MDSLRSLIRDVPDFPKPGILFKDITPLLRDPGGLSGAIDALHRAALPLKPDIVAGPESRGFIFAAPLALRLGAGFVPIRKRGKLPWRTVAETYDLEYGKDTVEMHADAVQKGQRVLLVDDLLATGGTMAACCRLVENAGASVVGCHFAIELRFLAGRSKLAPRPVHALIAYE